MIEAANHANQMLSVLMIDVDNFKKINDTHGHPKGDGVLKEIAARIAAIAASKGHVYRYGGDEFMVVLPNHDANEATVVAERMRRQVESTPVEGMSATGSFGVAVFPEHGATAADIISSADSAMYDAKKHGNNLVRISGEPPPGPDKRREPKRKLAMPGTLSDDRKTALRETYFRQGSIRCPNDGATLEVQEIPRGDDFHTGLLVHCRMCGLQEEL
jgi:diguanylate cyclase (GGDEF)-like protein